MMYGKTNYHLLSRFVREEIPEALIRVDRPRREPPRTRYGMPDSGTGIYAAARRRDTLSDEMRRAPDLFGAQSQRKEPEKTAKSRLSGPEKRFRELSKR